MFVTQKMNYMIREMRIDDYEDVYRLWEQTEGLTLEESDSREDIEIYLRRNQGLCFVACSDDRIVGTVLCGHEGRRGILRHLAVKRKFRDQGPRHRPSACEQVSFEPCLWRTRASKNVTHLSWIKTFGGVVSGSTWDGM